MKPHHYTPVTTPPSSDDTELDATLHELVTRLAHIQTRKAELDEEETQIKTQLVNTLECGTYSVNGQLALSISVGRRFDPALALEVLPPELITLCQATVIDTKRAREVLPPALYAQCQRENSKPTVRLP